MIAAATDRKFPIPEVQVVGKRFIVRGEVNGIPTTRTKPSLGEGAADKSHAVEGPVEKTGIIPTHVWG